MENFVCLYGATRAYLWGQICFISKKGKSFNATDQRQVYQP